MYVPPHFAVSDRAQLIDWMRQYSFALLVSTGADGAPSATHLPLLHVDDGSAHGKLVGHVARANPHWKLFDGKAIAMAMFWGPVYSWSSRGNVQPKNISDPMVLKAVTTSASTRTVSI